MPKRMSTSTNRGGNLPLTFVYEPLNIPLKVKVIIKFSTLNVYIYIVKSKGIKLIHLRSAAPLKNKLSLRNNNLKQLESNPMTLR